MPSPPVKPLQASAPQTVPRRFVVGALLSGVIAASAVGLGYFGAISAPKTESFRFSRGTQFAPGEEARLRAYLAGFAAEQRLHLRISGHTGTAGDTTANFDLSLARANAAMEIVRALGIPESRVDFVGGFGGTAPRAKAQDEGTREYERALARVTLESFVAR
ncbi:MAG: OmpA family protein [Pseudomonadota bacterium]